MRALAAALIAATTTISYAALPHKKAHADDPPGVPPPPEWRVKHYSFPESMSFTAIVNIDGKHQHNGTLAAFAGIEVRGVQSRPKFPPFGVHTAKAVYLLTIHGNEKDMISFQFHTGDAKAGTTTKLDKTVIFVNDGIEGNVHSPVILKGGKSYGDSGGSSIFKKLRRKLG